MSIDLSRKAFLRTTGVALTAGLAGCSSPDDAESSIEQSDATQPTLGQFYVGDPDAGEIIDGRAEVVAVEPVGESDKPPVVMVPGLGLSPYIYLTTPDGRPGWVEQFVAAGHPVYVFNPPRNVDSGGLDTEALENADSASLSRWSLDRAWPTWGFGPAVGERYAEVRYPLDAVDQLVASFPAYVSSGGGGQQGGTSRRSANGSGSTPSEPDVESTQTGGGSRFASSRETAALETLLDRVGPAVLLVHSAAGGSGFAVAQSVPELVDRIVAVEPVGCPTDPDTVSAMGGDAPFMGVYGDYVDERGQGSRAAACQTTADLAGETNDASTMLDLPAEGITGNTHLLMQDDNNADIADRIVSWIGAQ